MRREPMVMFGVYCGYERHYGRVIAPSFLARVGDSLRSKTDVAMKNETLAKLVCHNVCCVIQEMHEQGIDPTFWTESPPVHNVAAS